MTVDIAPLKELAKAATRISENDFYVRPFSTLSTFHDIAEVALALITEIETLRAAVHALTVERDETRPALLQETNTMTVDIAPLKELAGAATPCGQIEIGTVRQGFLTLGLSYYVDFTPAESTK